MLLLVSVVANAQPFPFDYTLGIRGNAVKMTESVYSASSYTHLGEEEITKKLESWVEYSFSDSRISSVVKENKRTRGMYTTRYEYTFSDGLLTEIRRLTDVERNGYLIKGCETDSFIYDDQKRLIEQRNGYSSDNEPLDKKQKGGYEMKLEVNHIESAVRRSKYSGQIITEYYVDEGGDECKAVWSNGGKTRTITRENVKSDKQYIEYYDSKGQLIKRNEKDFGKLLYTTVFKYDSFGNLVESRMTMPSYSLFQPEIYSYSYKYDEHHNWIEKREFHNGEITHITTRDFQYDTE